MFFPGVTDDQFVWGHYCVAIRYSDGTTSFYKNGKKLAVEKKVPSAEGECKGGGRLLLGQSQDRWIGLLASKSFSGHITDLNFYSRFLSDNEMEDFTSCR